MFSLNIFLKIDVQYTYFRLKIDVLFYNTPAYLPYTKYVDYPVYIGFISRYPAF